MLLFLPLPHVRVRKAGDETGRTRYLRRSMIVDRLAACDFVALRDLRWRELPDTTELSQCWEFCS